MSAGVIYGVLAFTLWGLFPIYWKAIERVPAEEILCHRMAWSLLFMAGLLAVRRRWGWILPALRRPRTVLIFLGTGSLLAVNWFTYIWAVNHGQIVGSSLGYFVNPLFSAVLGMVFLRERLRPGQWGALAIAAAGVAYLTFAYGTFPRIAAVLAVTFGFYGLIRKTAPLDAIEGLSLETAALFLPAASYLLYIESNGTGSFGRSGLSVALLLAGSGAVTALPLLWFAEGARRISLTSLGLLQYIAPSLQFLCGVLLYEEPLSRSRLAGFALVWIALAVYSAEGLLFRRRRRAARPAP
ncbi:MAG: EamA family transporter RarD [Candidatus Latescibacterota bacterium]|nr:MAG: EamA family transporter RarD [Candidatus Latescibacterota bacterium]